MKIRHLNLRNNTVQVRIHKKDITVVMKLGEMLPHLDRWLDWYTEYLAAQDLKLRGDYYLFPSRIPVTLPRDRQNHPSVYWANMRSEETGIIRPVRMRLRPEKPTGQPNDIARDILVRLGYPEDDYRLGMHVLRRSGALCDLEEMEEEGEGNPMPIIRERLNQRSDAMAAWYTGRSHDRKRSDEYYERKGEAARVRAAARGDNVVGLNSRRRPNSA